MVKNMNIMNKSIGPRLSSIDKAEKLVNKNNSSERRKRKMEDDISDSMSVPDENSESEKIVIL